MLGICLGFQLLFESLDRARRAPRASGCSPGEVEPARRAPGLKVPHIGWEPVRWERESELTEGIDGRDAVLLRPQLRARGRRDAADVLGTAAYGERFACAVERPPLYGVQFHPEKSSAAGLRAAAQLRRASARRFRR